MFLSFGLKVFFFTLYVYLFQQITNVYMHCVILIFSFSFSLQDISGTMKDLRFCPTCKLASFNDAASFMNIENWHEILGSVKTGLDDPW